MAYRITHMGPSLESVLKDSGPRHVWAVRVQQADRARPLKCFYSFKVRTREETGSTRML